MVYSGGQNSFFPIWTSNIFLIVFAPYLSYVEFLSSAIIISNNLVLNLFITLPAVTFELSRNIFFSLMIDPSGVNGLQRTNDPRQSQTDRVLLLNPLNAMHLNKFIIPKKNVYSLQHKSICFHCCVQTLF